MALIDLTQDIVLEDDRVLLRPLVPSDDAYLIPFVINEPDLWRYSLVPPIGEEGMKAYVANAIKSRELGKEYTFIVYDKQAKAYAGSTRFYDIQINQASMQLGYTWYGAAFQGTGLNQHCKYLLLSLAFEQWELGRVEFRADFDNKRLIAAMHKIGCTTEGILRSHGYRHDGSRRSSIILSILREEWDNGLNENLRKLLSDAR